MISTDLASFARVRYCDGHATTVEDLSEQVFQAALATVGADLSGTTRLYVRIPGIIGVAAGDIVGS